jgi:hypothetical protein
MKKDAHPVESVDKCADKHKRRLHAAQHSKNEERCEVAVVAVSDAVIDPRTVVVHFSHTTVALSAVMRTRRFETSAHFALLQPLGVLFLFLFDFILLN